MKFTFTEDLVDTKQMLNCTHPPRQKNKSLLQGRIMKASVFIVQISNSNV